MRDIKHWVTSADDDWFAATLRSPDLHEIYWPEPGEGWSEDDYPSLSGARAGTFFDEFLDFHDPDGDEFTLLILSELGRIETRKNRRSYKEARKHYTLVRAVLANGLRCAFHRNPSRVAYFGRANRYRSGHAWLNGRALSRTVKNLARADFLKHSRGFGGQNFKCGTASTYDVTPTLLGIARKCGVTPASLRMRLPPERLVRLKRGGKDETFARTPEINAWLERLMSWNEFIAQHEIEIVITPDEKQAWVKQLTDSPVRTGMPFIQPELFRTSLYRSFVETFDQHGRLYGGWWITAPKSVRDKITIDGKPTVELDYSGCGIGMLYNAAGLKAPEDPYELEEVTVLATASGCDPLAYRDTHKRILNALLNCDEGGRPEHVVRRYGLPIPADLTAKAVRIMLEEKHKPISAAFRTRAGLRLHREDADLALQIIVNLAEEGIVAIPVHDSFITPQIHKGRLRSTMENCYKARFGAVPMIHDHSASRGSSL